MQSVTDPLGTVDRRLTFLVRDGDGLRVNSSFTDKSACRLRLLSDAKAASPALNWLSLLLLLVAVGNAVQSLSNVKRTSFRSFFRLSS